MARLIRLVLGAALAALALGPFVPGSAANELELHAILSLTGPAAFLGREELQSLTVFEKTVNASGGVRGRPIKVVALDDQSNAQVAVQLANQLIPQNPGIILGPTTVAACSAVAPLLKNGPVLYCMSPGVHPEDGSFMFAANISTSEYMLATIRFLREKGWRRLAVVTSNDATGQDGDRVVDAAIADKSNGGAVSIVDREHFTPTDVSASAQIARIKASNAQVAIFWTNGTPLATLLRDAYQANLKLPIIASGGNVNYEQLAGYSAFVGEDLYLMSAAWGVNGTLARGPVRVAVDRYMAAFAGIGVRPAQGASLVWDPATLAIEAFRKFGPDASPEQIRSYIAGLKGWAGVNGVYDYAKFPQRGIGADWVVIIRWHPETRSFTAASKPGGRPV